MPIEGNIKVPKLYYVDYYYGIRYHEWRRIEEGTEVGSKWGRKKLFLTELYFLTLFTKVLQSDRIKNKPPKPKVVVYAGSSPGFHIPYLSKIFPDLKFKLIDPRPPGYNWREYPNITYHKGYYTERIGRELVEPENVKDLEILFMSDIRDFRGTPTDESSTADSRNESTVKDMDKQQDWVCDMRPQGSMLKLKFPFGEDDPNVEQPPLNVEYLDGFILLQPYIGETSTENRLIVPNPDIFLLKEEKKPQNSSNSQIINSAQQLIISEVWSKSIKLKFPTRIYDVRQYEMSMFFFNSFIRPPVGKRFQDDKLGFDPNDGERIPGFDVPVAKLKKLVHQKNEEFKNEREPRMREIEAIFANAGQPIQQDQEQFEFDFELNKLKKEYDQLKRDMGKLERKEEEIPIVASWDIWAELEIWKYFFEYGGELPDEDSWAKTPEEAYYATGAKMLILSKKYGKATPIEGNGESDEGLPIVGNGCGCEVIGKGESVSDTADLTFVDN